MFYTKPVGKCVLQVCRTLSCALNGAERVTEELRAKLGIEPGQTDATGTFTLIESEWLRACDRAPVVMVNDAWHECLNPADAARLVDDLRTRGEAAVSGCHHVIEAPKPLLQATKSRRIRRTSWVHRGALRIFVANKR